MALPQLIFFGIDLVTFGIDFLNFYALYLAVSLSLNLEFGYTGVPNFGKVLFIAGGAAFAGSISGRLAAYVYGINTHGDFITFNARIITQVDSLILNDPGFALGMVDFPSHRGPDRSLLGIPCFISGHQAEGGLPRDALAGNGSILLGSLADIHPTDRGQPTDLRARPIRLLGDPRTRR